jgi:thymidylate synthase (FAD)
MTISGDKEQAQALQDQLNQEPVGTRRVVVPSLEEILYKPLPVLDHGFVRVVDYMGDDSSIVQAARVSYGKGTERKSQDRGLIRYLLRHRHTTPFEMCEIKFHIKLPIFIARQWIRHRTANVNEYSARYSVLDKEFYIPEPQFLSAQSTTNNQGRSDASLSEDETARVLEILTNHSHQAYDGYLEMLNENPDGSVRDEARQGLTRELARMNLPVNIYTQWYWKIDLHNLLHFTALRADSHAQYEIQAYGQVMMDILKQWVPITAEAFEDYRVGGCNLSAQGLAIVKRMLSGENVTEASSGLSAREWGELMKSLDR